MKQKVITGDCLSVLKEMPDNSIDSLVTDPPAGISFMGKDWDDDKGGRDQWIAWMRDVMRECMRVMKPGAHGLVWAIPRTSHWTATSAEDAGFEVRDSVLHCFGQGFPKSLNIEKAGGGKEWSGWGTALKPAVEIWWLIRKPISEKTVAKNVLKWGVGGINIDGCRVVATDGQDRSRPPRTPNKILGNGKRTNLTPSEHNGSGRFPANLVLSHSSTCTDDACDMFECPIALLDEQSGTLKSGAHNGLMGSLGYQGGKPQLSVREADSGGASRFFYCAKASKADKNAGCEGLPKKPGGSNAKGYTADVARGLDRNRPTENFHPTVKSTKLMSYLIKLVTPPGGTVLDPFTGSGSTGVAAVKNGFKFIGIEREAEYQKIAKARIEHAEASL